MPDGERFTLGGFGLEMAGPVVHRYPPGVQNLAADHLTYLFPDRSVGIDDVAFEAERGDLICILGPSGCGKSTLLSVLTGAYEPTRGSVRIFNRDGKKILAQRRPEPAKYSALTLSLVSPASPSPRAVRARASFVGLHLFRPPLADLPCSTSPRCE